jgi:hypothetical protein
MFLVCVGEQLVLRDARKGPHAARGVFHNNEKTKTNYMLLEIAAMQLDSGSAVHQRQQYITTTN